MACDSSYSQNSGNRTPTNKYTNSSRNIFNHRLELDDSFFDKNKWRHEETEETGGRNNGNITNLNGKRVSLMTPIGSSNRNQKVPMTSARKSGKAGSQSSKKEKDDSESHYSLRHNENLNKYPHRIENLQDRVKLLKEPTRSSLDKPTATREGSSSPIQIKVRSTRKKNGKITGPQKTFQGTGASHFSFLTNTDQGALSSKRRTERLKKDSTKYTEINRELFLHKHFNRSLKVQKGLI